MTGRAAAGPWLEQFSPAAAESVHELTNLKACHEVSFFLRISAADLQASTAAPKDSGECFGQGVLVPGPIFQGMTIEY